MNQSNEMCERCEKEPKWELAQEEGELEPFCVSCFRHFYWCAAIENGFEGLAEKLAESETGGIPIDDFTNAVEAIADELVAIDATWTARR